MLSSPIHILLAPWRWAATRASLLWRTLSVLPTLVPRSVAADATLIGSPADVTPLTDEQRKQREASFIRSLDGDAVCALASLHNNNLPCRLDESTPTANGSFNVCFFIDFYTSPERTQWVVRVPIEPVVHRAWDKLQSEVCTIQYIRAHTAIPDPRVLAAQGMDRQRQGPGLRQVTDQISLHMTVRRDLQEANKVVNDNRQQRGWDLRLPDPAVTRWFPASSTSQGVSTWIASSGSASQSLFCSQPT